MSDQNIVHYTTLSATEKKENIEKTKYMTIEDLDRKPMNLMETKTISDDKADTMEKTIKEELMLIPEDKKATEKMKDAIIDKSAAEIANLKEENTLIDERKHMRKEQMTAELIDELKEKITTETKEMKHAQVTEIGKDRKTEYCHVKKCYKCGSDEHLIRECDSDNRKWNKYHILKACHICKKTGHRATDCWFKDQVDGKRRCFRCGSDSHLVKFCPLPRDNKVSPVIADSQNQLEPRYSIKETYGKYRSKEEEAINMIIAASTLLTNFRCCDVSSPGRHLRRGGECVMPCRDTLIPVTAKPVLIAQKTTNG